MSLLTLLQDGKLEQVSQAGLTIYLSKEKHFQRKWHL